MTPRQMQIAFEKSATYVNEVKEGSIRIDSDHVNYYLNQGGRVIFNKKLNNATKETSDGIKVSQRELDEVKNLIIKNQTLIKDNSLTTSEYDVYTLPDNYYFMIADKTTTSHFTVEKIYQNRMYSSERIHEVLEDTHYGTKYNSPVSELANNKLYIYKKSNFTISNVKIDYIKDFTEVNVITDQAMTLDESLHEEVVQMAITIFLENINSGRFRTSIEKNTITEQLN